MQTVPQIRVFLASPGDVNEERAVALEVLDMLEYDPLFKRNGAGGVSIHAIAWDKPGGDTPMRATMTPQTAIKQGLPRPSQCDVVIVLFWGRMGTPLPHPEYQKDDGSPFHSGTEWEYHDAVSAERQQGKPRTYIYRRAEEPRIDMKDRKQVAQYHTVLDFFEQFRDPDTGALLGGVNEYQDPEDLRQKLINHLRLILDNILKEEQPLLQTPNQPVRPQVEAPPLWKGSPFPGLRAYDESDAPIFFGRGLETSDLVKRVEVSRFSTVVAASGSGKSSLVAAGLIPRLKVNAIVSGDTGSKDWRYARLTPGGAGSPLEAIFVALCEAFPEHAVSPFMVAQEKQAFIQSVTHDPHTLIDICEALLKEAKAPGWAEVLFFIDQFEELFTVVNEADQTPFIALLEAIFTSRRLRVVITMRSDFYANCLELPALAALLKDASYPLAAPTAGALYEMITRPAERAGLNWESGLPDRILTDTGVSAGALALMAYALDELYEAAQARGDQRLTFADYEAVEGVQGAIGRRAEATFARLALPDKERLLQRVFRELVSVDERGTATRQRAALLRFDADERALIRAFADARLLVTDHNSVEVAHEAVFRSWERLKNWIAEAQEDLILLRQVRAAAEEWTRKGQPDFLRWPAERLKPVYDMLERQQPPLSETEQTFIEPEQNRRLRELEDISTDHKQRRWLGERLATITDTRFGIGLDEHGLPQIDWLPIKGGEITLEKQQFKVPAFYIAKFLVTYAQFQAFCGSLEIYEQDQWWQGMPSDYQKQAMSAAVAQYDNYPRDSVSWYQAVAFTRWLDARYREMGLFASLPPRPAAEGHRRLGEGPGVRVGNWQLRLPTEWEWQWAAQNGTQARKYPWGEWDEYPRANTTEAGIGDRSTAVGMYPSGAADCGALDMAGNLWEWCLNDHQDIRAINYINNEYKVLRGGSFSLNLDLAACSSRDDFQPYRRYYYIGFRVVVSPLLAHSELW